MAQINKASPNPSPPTSREQEALSLLKAAAKQEGWEAINPEAPCWKASVAAIIAAVDAERERCAAIADAILYRGGHTTGHDAICERDGERYAAHDIATAIRNPEGETL